MQTFAQDGYMCASYTQHVQSMASLQSHCAGAHPISFNLTLIRCAVQANEGP